LSKQNATVDWHRKILDEATALAVLVPENKKFRTQILANTAEARARLKLPPLSGR
jgi:hypothetical protein